MRTIVIVGALALLAGCGGGQVDVEAIETQIASWAVDQGAVDPTADCPASVDWKVGGDFHCIVTDGATSYRVTVSMENDDGDVTWVVG